MRNPLFAVIEIVERADEYTDVRIPDVMKAAKDGLRKGGWPGWPEPEIIEDEIQGIKITGLKVRVARFRYMRARIYWSLRRWINSNSTRKAFGA